MSATVQEYLEALAEEYQLEREIAGNEDPFEVLIFPRIELGNNYTSEHLYKAIAKVITDEQIETLWHSEAKEVLVCYAHFCFKTHIHRELFDLGEFVDNIKAVRPISTLGEQCDEEEE